STRRALTLSVVPLTRSAMSARTAAGTPSTKAAARIGAVFISVDRDQRGGGNAVGGGGADGHRLRSQGGVVARAQHVLGSPVVVGKHRLTSAQEPLGDAFPPFVKLHGAYGNGLPVA